MEFEIHCIANGKDSTIKTANFFAEVRNAAKNAAKNAGVSFSTDRLTPDDESLPYALAGELTRKAPCVFLVRPDNSYLVLNGLGKAAIWQQKFYEIFKGYDSRAKNRVAAVEITIVYTSYVPYNNQTRLRNAVKKFFPQDIPYVLNEFHADSAQGKNRLGENTIVPNIISNVGAQYGLILLDGSQSADGWIFPSDEQFKDYFGKIAEVYNRWKKGEKIEEIKKDEVRKEEKAKEEAKKANPLSDAAHDLLCSMGLGNFKKTIYALGGVFLAYQAMKAPTKTGQYGFAAGAAYCAYLAVTAEDNCKDKTEKK
jgi:hypothetical protein